MDNCREVQMPLSTSSPSSFHCQTLTPISSSTSSPRSSPSNISPTTLATSPPLIKPMSNPSVMETEPSLTTRGRMRDLFGSRPFQFHISRQRGRSGKKNDPRSSESEVRSSTSHHSRQSPEPHPGTLITTGTELSEDEVQEWTSCSCSSSSSPPLPRTPSASRSRQKEYHQVLRSLAQSTAPNPQTQNPPQSHQNSSLSHSPTHDIESTASTNIPPPPIEPHHRRENIYYQAKKLERRARSQEERDRILREGNSPLTTVTNKSATSSIARNRQSEDDTEQEGTSATASRSSSSANTTPSTHSTDLDPSSSISLFLQSVHASFEMRKRGKARQLSHPELNDHIPDSSLFARTEEWEGGWLSPRDSVTGMAGWSLQPGGYIVVVAQPSKTYSQPIFVDEFERGFLDSSDGAL